MKSSLEIYINEKARQNNLLAVIQRQSNVFNYVILVNRKDIGRAK